MQRQLGILVAGLLLVTAVVPAGAAATQSDSTDSLEAYTATVSLEQLADLREGDYEIAAVHRVDGETATVELILAGFQAAKLEEQGVTLSRNAGGQDGAVGPQAFDAASDGVYRSYSEAGGLADEVRQTHADHPNITKLVSIGTSVQGQDILALKVTKNANRIPDGTKKAVLYVSAQHAREWITPEVNRRLLHHITDSYGSDRQLTTLVNSTELWFVLVANPDGYDHTFEPGGRLWRKNLRDNNGDGAITTIDGVDLNRNFSTNWGLDNEGSSPDFFSQTYRGPAPGSEPETTALDALMDRIGFEFIVNWHSAAELLLYGVGWQVDTPTPDDLVYQALVGTDEEPAVPGFDPDLSAELYITNGDTTDHAHTVHESLAMTPELSTCQTVSAEDPDDEWEPGDCQSVFNFPDDEELIQAEFDKNLAYALDVAKSARDADDPVSHLGNVAPDFEIDAFSTSYGSPQTVQAFAKRSVGDVALQYRINGGTTQSVAATEWDGGERYGEHNDVHYRYVRGVVPDGQPGDTVEVWFEATGSDAASEAFTYTVAEDSGADVLILADTDYGSVLSGGVAELRYVQYYEDALAANGYSSTLYDVEGHDEAPHALGVLSHFDAVVWYTGDNLVTDYQGGLNTVKLAHDMNMVLRDYMNEGGKLLATGKNLGFQEFFPLYYGTNGAPEEPCHSDDPNNDCLVMTDDVFQYWLGGFARNRRGGLDSDGNALPVEGISNPFAGLSWGLDGGDSAMNQGAAGGANDTGTGTASWIPTSNILPADDFPQFASERSARFETLGAAPYEPRTGSFQVASQQADVSYKRLTRTIDLTGATSAELTFWSSYDVEPDWDQFFVEAHTVGQDDWTTLPDQNGHTAQDPGASCEAGWNSLHPHLEHYQTINPDGTCSSTGTTGEWHSANGTSGWDQWSIDLSAYAGEQVEVSIAYASDWAVQGLGVYIDDVAITVDGSEVTATSFETDLGGWTVAGSPPGSAPNPNDWIRTGVLFDVSAAVTAEDSILFGFGLEGVSTPEERNAVMGAALGELLP